MNSVCLYGRLGQDPELRHTQSGTAVLNLRLATSERRKRGDAWEDHTEWHSVTVWGTRAEVVARYLRKGSAVSVVGRLSTSSYEDKEGNRRYRTEVVASDVEFGARSDAPRTQEPREEHDDVPF